MGGRRGASHGQGGFGMRSWEECTAQTATMMTAETRRACSPLLEKKKNYRKCIWPPLLGCLRFRSNQFVLLLHSRS